MSKKNRIENEKMRQISFEEFQKMNFDGFKKINEELESEGIFWWAHSGTVLGAVREGGPIPWDDDIDMGMTIHDWELNKKKIKSIAEKNGYKLMDKVTRLGMDISRLVMSEKFRVTYENKEYVASPFIDIMIGLPVKKESKFRSNLWFIFSHVMFIFNSFWKPLPDYGWKFHGDMRKISVFEHVGLFIIRIILIPLLIVYPIEYIWFKIAAKKDKDKVSFHYNWSHLDFVYDKSEMTKIKFGSTMINVREDYMDEILLRFGEDWKQPPSEIRRVPHHMILVPYFPNKKYHIYPYIVK